MPTNGSEDKLEARTSEDSKFLLCGPRKNMFWQHYISLIRCILMSFTSNSHFNFYVVHT